jgi:hypothetical protein
MRSIGVIAGAFFLLGFTVEERERKKEKKNWGSLTDGFFFFFFLWFIDFDRV